jgi:cytochrome c peroxidase
MTRFTAKANSPTLFDVALMPRLHHDGEFPSLEALVKGTFAGRPMGWLPGEGPPALARMQAVLLNDQGEGRGAEGPYRDQFKKAFGVDLSKLSREELADLTAKAVSDFMRTIKSRRNSPYDQFIQANNLAAEPKNGESSAAFGRRLLAQVSDLEARRALKLPPGFEAEALSGLKIFFRTTNATSTTAVGNCVACHTPPLFTDFSFHNVGVSQRDYDKVHGEGQFAGLSIPDAADANRPASQFRQVPAKGKPGAADLGHWNFVDLKTSPVRRVGESDDELLRRMIGAFKTPTLRNLAYSDPYLHTGALTSLPDVINEMIESSELARAGRLRAVDEELKTVRITDGDILPLLAFLGALNENLKKVH